MRMEYADPLVIKTPEGKDTWPQHLVVVSPTKAYVQYSESGMEATSGICALTLGDGSVEVGATVEGTFGAFSTEGAVKTRMVLSRGKLFAGCGHSLVIVDPATDAVEKRITYEGRQVKGVVKGADGNIYFALAGTYSGTSPNMGTLTSDPMIVGIDHSGTVVSEKRTFRRCSIPDRNMVSGYRHVRQFHRSLSLFCGYRCFQRHERNAVQLPDADRRLQISIWK